MDAKKWLMSIFAILFGTFEMVYKINNSMQMHYIAISMLLSSGIFMSMELVDFVAFIIKKIENKKHYA